MEALKKHLAVPDWVKTSAREFDSWKVVIRTAVAFFAAFVIILPNPSLNVLGNAAFFAAISICFIPPAYPVQMYFLAVSTMLFGALLGWGWGVAAMAAALRARSQTLLASQIEREQASVAGQSNPDVLYQRDLFRGVFLDPASSAVFGAFLAVGTFFAAYLKARAPKLALTSVFLTIFVDVMCSYGPLFPASNFFLLNSFLISAGSGIAIGVACSILIFPTSMSYLFSKALVGNLAIVKSSIELQKEALATDLSDDEKWEGFSKRTADLRAQRVGSLTDLDSKTGMLELEVSRGRLSSADLKELYQSIRTLNVRAGNLRTFIDTVSLAKSRQAADAKRQHTSPTSARLLDSILTMADTQAKYEQLEGEHGHRLQDLLPLARQAFTPLLVACEDGLQGATGAHKKINTSRWSKADTSPLGKEELRLDHLRSTLVNFRQDGRLAILEPYRRHFPDHSEPLHVHNSDIPFSLRSLFALFAFQSDIVMFAEELLRFLELSVRLQRERQVNRFWAPTGLRKLAHIALDRRHDSSLPEALQDDSTESSDTSRTDSSTVTEKVGGEKHEEARIGLRFDARDPDAQEPTFFVQRMGRRLRGLYGWLGSAEGLFCLKYMLISVAFWLPSVFRSTAYFNYTQKGRRSRLLSCFAYALAVLWAMIMAQTGLGVYVSDQLSTYAFRIAGTVFGGLVGMILWYISTGSGNGNRYALGAVMGVVAIPFAFIRVNVPPQQMIFALLFIVTTVLVVGYSHLNTHLPQLSNIGWGWDVAWRRTLLVVVGLAGAAVMMVLPPQSGHVMVRKSAARCLGDIMNLYELLIEGWIDDEAIHHSQESRYIQLFRERYIATLTRVNSLTVATNTARSEVNLRGPWPYKPWSRLVELEHSLLLALLQLASALHRLDNDWRRRAMHRTAFLNPHLIGEVVSVGTVISTSLRIPQPISSAVPKRLTDRLVYFTSTNRRDDDVELTWSTMEDEELATFASAVLASLEFLARLDDLHEVARELVGTVEMEGLARRWQQRS